MNKNKFSYLVGITGNFGSGKSTVGNIIAEFDKNILVIDTDDIVKFILSSKNNITDSLVKKFGDNILLDDNVYINRKSLAECIFKNKENRIFAEGLIHPEVINVLKEYISDNQNAPLLLSLFLCCMRQKWKSCLMKYGVLFAMKQFVLKDL